jgi:hypothetical protein
LPARFAPPAGGGDRAAGLSAPVVARNPRRREAVVAWSLFGLGDLVLAIFLGATTNPGPVRPFFTTPTSEVLTPFPMALLPASRRAWCRRRSGRAASRCATCSRSTRRARAPPARSRLEGQGSQGQRT